MAISFVGAASAEAASVALPTHQAGDLIVVAAFRWNSSAGITMPSDYWLIATRRAGQFSLEMVAKIAKSENELSGTLTNATHVVAAVFRADNYLATGAIVANSAAGTVMSYASLISGSPVEKRIIAAGATIINSTNADTPPSGLSLVEKITGATDGELAIHASTNSNNWTGASVGIASTQYGTIVAEIVDTGVPIAGGGASFPPIGPGGLVY